MATNLKTPGLTKWTNPEDRPAVKLHLYMKPPVVQDKPNGGFVVVDTGFLDIELGPGESCMLPSHLDNAIQRLDEHGVVHSGECPWLIKNDGEAPELHQSLDPVEQQRIQAELDIEKARAKEAEAELERAKAQQLLKEAEDKQRENDARAKADAEARKKLEDGLAELERAKAEIARKNAELDKMMEQATKPADTGSGGGSANDSKSKAGKGG